MWQESAIHDELAQLGEAAPPIVWELALHLADSLDHIRLA